MKLHSYLISYRAIKSEGGYIVGDIHFDLSIKIRKVDIKRIKGIIEDKNMEQGCRVNNVIIQSIYYFGKIKKGVNYESKRDV